jgi:hypothetical protein
MNLRRVFTASTLLLVTGLVTLQIWQLLANPSIWPPDDFIEYWAAARLLLEGQNPYDPALLHPLQLANGRQTDEAVMMWNPPWTLTIVQPLGFLTAREAQLLWLAFNCLAMLFCGDRLWLIYGGQLDRRWLGWIIALVALPTIFALQSGQISPLLLLGAVSFLECRRRGWDYLAGGSTVLLAIKPHLAYLVWMAIVLEAVTRQRWKVLVGGIAFGLLSAVVPLMLNPTVWQHYATALTSPPAQWLSPTFGTVLRLWFGSGQFGLQFIPMAIGISWFAWRWYRFRDRWDWAEQLPLVLLVSFLTAPYGAWPFDLVLLLPVAMLMLQNWHPEERSTVLPDSFRSDSNRPSRMALAGLLAINFTCLILNLSGVSSFWFIWVAPAMLVLYVAVRRTVRVRDSVRLVRA